MKYIIKTQECGYLFKNGILKKLLFAGKHQVFGLLGEKLVVTEMTGKVDTVGLPVEVLMENPQFRERVIRVQIPAMYRHLIPARLYKRLAVGEGETGLLYIDGQFEKQLSPGTYFYWIYAQEVSMKLYSLKVQQLEISGQEILTADKVGVRLNILCSYRITDPLGLVQKTDNVGNLLYTRIQLLAREYIGGFRLDELLARKEEISGFLMKRLRDAQAEYCVEILNTGIKDIILPGEIRDIMNTVLVAEKKAQANVITRREEVASTRSLLNTAKLMEENKVLYRLKELEYLERICDRVGSISLSGAGSVLEQLAALALPKG